MPKTALVLSGGGAKGAFQFMAEKYAREVKGYRWDVIAGVSVGALNGAMIAMEKFEALEKIWRTVSNRMIYTGRLNFWAGIRLLLGAKSIYGNKPLWKLIQQEIDPAQIKIPLRIGVVSLQSGEYLNFTPQDPNFVQAVLASTAIPIFWKPVTPSPRHPDLADGGLRNTSPLGDVLDTEPDEVIIINCDPFEPTPWNRPLKSVLDIAERTLDIMLNEIFVTDVREFIRINHNAAEAAAAGIILHNENGKPYKQYRYQIIQPDQPLTPTLDFSRRSIEASMALGWEKAKSVLG